MGNLDAEHSLLVQEFTEIAGQADSSDILVRQKAVERMTRFTLHLLEIIKNGNAQPELSIVDNETTDRSDNVNGDCDGSLEHLIQVRKQLEIEKLNFQDYLLAAGAGTWRLDVETDEEIYDELFASMTGHGDRLLSGYIFNRDSITNPDDLEQSRIKLKECIDGETDVYICELRITHADGHEMYVEDKGKVVKRDPETGKALVMLGTSIDISQRKKVEKYSKLNSNLLEIYNQQIDIQSMVEQVIDEIKKQTGLDAIGISLRKNNDFPYFYQKGFPDEFILTENSLLEYERNSELCRGKNGNSQLECTCGIVLSGKTNSNSPLFTEKGSFWTNNSISLLNIPISDDPRHNPMNHCMHFGYASMALIPIKNRDEIIGLIHLNDRREECFSSLIIDQMEKIASHLGEAIVRKQIEEALKISEEQFRTITEQSPIAIEYYDTNGFLVSANPACLEMFGIIEKNEIDQFSLFDDPNISDGHKTELKQGKFIRYEASFDFDMVKKLNLYNTSKSGQVWLDILITPIADGSELPSGYLLQVQDITQRKRLEEENRVMATHDYLTGLGNRRYLDDSIEKIGLDRQTSVISIDGLGLKDINDRFGHDVGDMALVKIAEALKQSIRPKTDIVARTGGDEFIIILPDTSEEESRKIIERIQNNLNQLNKSSFFQIGISVGIASTSNVDDMDDLMKKADHAMYRHKKEQKSKK